MAYDFTNITTGALSGTGYFDKLMSTLRLHIADAVANNEITQEQAGQVYTGVIPGMLDQAVKFETQKETFRLGKIPSTLK